MTIVSIGTAFVLLALALFHLIWSLKIWWPLKSERDLAHAVAGFANTSEMPSPAICAIVGIALFTASGIAFCLVSPKGGYKDPLLLTSGAILSLVFLVRGVAGYLPFWAKLTPVEPFRSLDRMYYSPLCILLAISFGLLVIH